MILIALIVRTVRLLLLFDFTKIASVGLRCGLFCRLLYLNMKLG